MASSDNKVMKQSSYEEGSGLPTYMDCFPGQL